MLSLLAEESVTCFRESKKAFSLHTVNEYIHEKSLILTSNVHYQLEISSIHWRNYATTFYQG